ncbi:nucleoside-diphosphate sugar epimerase [Blautia sp. An249]|uniref:polysaccharide biosynthesis protein n=1 Tax=Blautia sp. An249 TaxID=1965603 RepID=UPI000B36F2BB|nr:nucleoside-diphosphate sugar epimerase/dehydratase [Blautia sp. An249]OUO79387.1 nucleoside-diphosphate sugar epimerase [Blautia sp. An249]
MRGTLFNRKKKFEHWELIALYLVAYDIVAVNFAYFFGLWLRFDLQFSHIPQDYLSSFLQFTPVYTIFSIIVFYRLRLYKSLWRFASLSELNRIVCASAITSLFQIVGITVFCQRMPVSYYLIGAALQFAAVVGVRFSYRYIILLRKKKKQTGENVRNAMVIGAGAAGQIIIKELKNSSETRAVPCCIIDDNSNKWGRFMYNVPIVGGRDSIMENVKKYHIDEILFAIPTARPEERRDILNICKETGCDLKSLPGVYQLANGEVSLSKMKAVAVEELLGRDPIKVDLEEIFRYLRGKTILVTGGGGSIGSELCRQIAGHEPKQLIVFDIYENSVYDIEQELKRKYPNLNLTALIGSVRDSRRINQVFETYHPEIVYHAAAHKHVPLMETSPNEAIKNNVIGTYKTAYAALKNGTQRFVLISTDKAVNPTNIMGASKRLCEMIIQSMDVIAKAGRMEILPFLHEHSEENDENLKISATKTKTEFVAVRFGNVLGSNGSVIPLFKKQIEAGGPVTVTHPDIIRYFMTIPEAVSLVLQAGVLARGGEIFVLDMGEPVKIDTLARNLIKLSGYKPDEDIQVVYTGLRLGEKLFEEKLMAEEGMKKTKNELIHIGKPIPFNTEVFLLQLTHLAKACNRNSEDIVGMVEEMVTTFHPAEEKPEEKIKKKERYFAEQTAMMEEAAVTVENR